ncbi:MAG TPA: hypothetical protein VNR87_08930 [Flavisolibacter sp.]|nr:hypothetical protein [Flavisolibacter sp.]
MPVRIQHDLSANSFFFVTFTCFKWFPLFKLANAYDTVYKWFDHLFQHSRYVTGYVIMPNHLHVLLYFPKMSTSLNMVIGNAKRFMAYEIIKRLEEEKQNELLGLLHAGVQKREARKGQLHKVFEDSFDAKACYTPEFIFQKLAYMHHNPVRKKWNLADDFTMYQHSSALYYEKGVKRYEKIIHVNDALSGNVPGSLPFNGTAQKTPGGR